MHETGLFDKTAFHIACECGDIQSVEYLLMYESDVYKLDTLYKITPIDYARKQGHAKVVEFLMKFMQAK